MGQDTTRTADRVTKKGQAAVLTQRSKENVQGRGHTQDAAKGKDAYQKENQGATRAQPRYKRETALAKPSDDETTQAQEWTTKGNVGI